MIRPVTCVCFVLACASGLYLYQAKHRVQVLDREIERTVRATDELREQTRILHAEWTLQNDPQRLQALADQFFSLKTVTPGQFTSLADLDNRLPAVRAPEPPASEKLVADGQPAPVEEPPAVAPLPPPPKPAVVVATISARPPEPRPIEARSVERRASPPPRPAIAEALPVRHTPVIARPEPARPITVAAPVPMTGSALGMARSASAPPPPRPMPVSATQWAGEGGGGG